MDKSLKTKCLYKNSGQDLAEYGLLIGLIALIAVAGISLFGGNLLELWNTIVSVF